MGIFSAGSASVQIVPDFRGAEASIKSFFAGQGDIKVKVTPDLANGDVARTEAELNAMHGTAKVEVDRNVLSSSIAKGIETALGTSGLGKLGGLLTAGIKPAILTTVAGGLTEVAAAAGQAVGAVALLPAGLLAIAAPAAAVKIGVEGVGNAFKAIDTGNAQKIAEAMSKLAPAAQQFVLQVHALAPAWQALRLDVQQQLFAGLGTSVTGLANVALPVLRTGLAGVAADLNSGLVATFATLKNDAPQFTTIFGNITSAGHTLAGTMAPLVQAFVTLATVGSQFLPGLATGFAHVAQEFANWVQQAAASGRLVQIIQNAIDAIKQLATIAVNVGKVVGAIFEAALPGGQILLRLLGDLTGQLAVFLHSDIGQSSMAAFFNSIQQAISLVLPVLGQLVQVVIATLLPVLGQLVAALAPVIAQLGQQLVDAIRLIAPLLPPVVQVVAALAGAFAPLIPVIAQIITTLLPPLITFLGQLAPIIGQVAQIFGQALLTAVQAVAPLLPVLGNAFIQILNALVPLLPPILQLVTSLLPPLVKVIEALLPVIVLVITQGFVPLAQALLPVVQVLLPPLFQLINALLPIIPPLAQAFIAVVQALLPILPAVAQLISVLLPPLISLLTPLIQLFGTLLVGAVTVLAAVLKVFVGVLVAVLGGIASFISGAINFFSNFSTFWSITWGAISAFFTNIWNTISSTAQAVWNAIAGFFTDAWNRYTAAWQIVWNAVSAFFQNIWNGISSFFQNIWNAISSFAQTIWNAIANFFTDAWNRYRAAWEAVWGVISAFFQGIWNAISSFAQTIWNAIANFFTDAWNRYTAAWQAVWNAISSFFQNIWNAISSFAQNIWNSISSYFTDRLNAFIQFWQNVWNVISSFFQGVWNGISSFAQGIWNAISGFFTDSLTVFLTFWQNIWNNVAHGFALAWDGIKAFASKVWDEIKAIIAVPINFVINTILNGGLFKAWNAVNDFLGLPWHIGDIPPIPGFSEGGFTGQGIYGTGGREDPAGVVHAGEFVHTQETTKQWLPMFELIHQGLLKPSDLGLPGFATGGLASTPQSQWTWPELNQIREKMFPGSLLNDGYRPGANDYHGAGQAIDIGWPGNDAGHLAQIAAALGAAFPGMTEGIHNPNLSIKNGRQVPPSFWGAATWAQHGTHVHWAETPQALAQGNANPGGTSLVTIAGQVINNIGDILNQLTGSITGPVQQLLGKFGQNHWVQILSALPKKLLDGLWNKVSGAVGAALANIQSAAATAAGIGGGTPGQVNLAGIKSEAFQIAGGPGFGWQSAQEQQGLDYIATHESNWNPKAQNPVSSASGIWQLVNGTWNAYKNAGPWPTAKDAPSGEQDYAAFRYIRGRYGDPIAAQQYWAVHHNYDTGGWLPPGYSTVFNGTGRFEAVLNSAQQDSISNALQAQDGTPVWHFYLGSQEITDLVDTRVTFHNARDGRTIRSSR